MSNRQCVLCDDAQLIINIVTVTAV